ncbi:YjbH domain-containing protein [Vibrio anguillarum]|uniref:YjbH domain-containing protein n=31 Tax=Vibrio anguillarum TaxID=55601 RepID=A0ABD4QTD6_VIBAN|nr:YjbH domain-containing protein [Vibrio anguillarum]MBT2918474.1 YjbH domain-containing protein [Vibrio anguillarum]
MMKLSYLSSSTIQPPRVTCMACCIALSLALPSQADEFSYPTLVHSQTDFGGTGLIQMPSARMMPEGQFSLSVTNNDDYIHYVSSLQLFPWLEATIRYTQVHELLYSGDTSFSGDTKYTDKSIDAKLRLLEEGYWLPEVSVGLRDVGGTGLFDGEFIAASKRFGPLDVTLGVGWGYLGNNANLTGDKSSTPDCGRDGSYSGKGGQFDIGRMFTGCTSLFGGVEYQTPWQPLRLKVEYDGNDYRSDFPVTRGDAVMPVSTPWNFGVVYALADWADLRLSYERGNTFTAGITLGTNLATMQPVWVDEPKPSYAPKAKSHELDDAEWQTLLHDLDVIAGYKQATLYQDDATLTIEAEQYKYRDRKEAHERAALLLANQGIDAQTYRIIETANNQPLTETRIKANAFARVADRDYPNAHITDASARGNPVAINGEVKAQQYDAWQFGLAPVLQQSFGGSEDFYLYALGVSANASVQTRDHWLLSGSLYGNLADNYDKYKYTVPPDGTDLKRVRTLSRQYYEDAVRLDSLQLTYFDTFGQSWFGQSYAGYLETMFAGVGGEILYRPLGKNWAVGIDGNYVKQRDPDTAFGLYKEEVHSDPQTGRNYRVQTGTVTGHATLYWQPKFWSLIDNTLLKVSAGRYLTDDIGMSVDFSKQFDSGVIAGAFISKTNLSAEEFGEGSFTKGFYVSIPMDLMTIRPSTQRVTVSWLPIQRDGGQMLNRQYRLYDMTDARSPWYGHPISSN